MGLIMSEEKRKYESVIVISTKFGEEKIKEIVEKFKNFLKEKAELLGVDEWGKKLLSYPIKYEKEGYYVLFNFKSAPDFSAELDRIYRITDGILRSIIVSNER